MYKKSIELGAILNEFINKMDPIMHGADIDDVDSHSTIIRSLINYIAGCLQHSHEQWQEIEKLKKLTEIRNADIN